MVLEVAETAGEVEMVLQEVAEIAGEVEAVAPTPSPSEVEVNGVVIMTDLHKVIIVYLPPATYQ